MTATPVVPILIVDDNPAKRMALRSILEPLAYSIVEAGSGRDALRCVMAHEFAVILMDVAMPGMDGFETAAAIRQRRQSQVTPIIFITAHAKDEIVKYDLYAEDAVDFIFAPVPPGELQAKVSVFANLFIKAEELAVRAREVKASADQLRLLTDAAPVGIFQTDAQNRYVYTNPRWSEITGIPAGEAEGRQCDMIIASDQRAGVDPQLAPDSADRAELSHRFKLDRPGSHPVNVVATSRSVPDNKGGTAGWVGTLADVTAEAGAEAAMAEARDAATEASRLKSDFLANMSHEIRTPMNGVIGMTDLLLETPLDARQRDYAMTVRNSGEALLTIIDHILDFSKVEAGHLEIEEVGFDLRGNVEAVVDLLAGSAHAKGIEMVVAIEDVPAIVCGDPGRVRQVLLNLIGNAIKFTQAGEIVVRVASTVSGGDVVVRFEVSDTGDGMGDETLKTVFQPFVQADSSTSRKYGGTGLGLAICSQLAELMGGDCGASSQLGKGSKFWFTISVRADPSQTALSPDPDLANVTVLIASDNGTRRGVLFEYLSAWGMRVEMAASGDAALAALRVGAAEHRPFDVALLDGPLPGVNGLDLKDEMSKDEGISTQAVLMVPRGGKPHLDPESEAWLRLFKPVHLADLRATLRVATGLEDPGTALGSRQSLPAKSAEPTVGCLLVAEDNLVNQKVAVAMLSGAGYHVDTVLNGAEAVQAIARRRYDAVLMDCQMPEMNGYEAATAIREGEGEDRQIPIIALTASARPEDRLRCETAGMDDYLAKPVSKEALLAMVARYVKKHPTAGGYLDEQVVAELEALDDDILREVTSQYFDAAAEQLSDLGGAIGRGEAVAVGEYAHKLKGGSCTVGAASVSQLASELEMSAMAGDLSSADLLLEGLAAGVEDAREAFRSRAEHRVHVLPQ